MNINVEQDSLLNELHNEIGFPSKIEVMNTMSCTEPDEIEAICKGC
jgi:hypothetical protein